MIVKIYATLWALIGASAVLIFAAGYFMALTGVVYGFICLGMTFMGMMGVLPASFHKEKHSSATPVKSFKPSIENHQSLSAANSANIENIAFIAKTA